VSASRPVLSVAIPGAWCVFVNQDGEYGVGTLANPPTAAYGDVWRPVKSGLDSQSQTERVAERMETYAATVFKEDL